MFLCQLLYNIHMSSFLSLAFKALCDLALLASPALSLVIRFPHVLACRYTPLVDPCGSSHPPRSICFPPLHAHTITQTESESRSLNDHKEGQLV